MSEALHQSAPPERSFVPHGASSVAGNSHHRAHRQSRAARLRVLQNRLSKSQWFSPEAIGQAQGRQLAALLRHASIHSPYYRNLLGRLPSSAVGEPLAFLEDIPLLNRETLQHDYAELCARWPEHHGVAQEFYSSGSTGQPVKVRRTDRCQLVWLALTLRDHLWHRRDLSATFAAIRVMHGQPPGVSKTYPSWGEAASAHQATGPMHLLPVTTDVRAQAKWLAETNPEYLLSYPSNLVAVLHAVEEEQLSLNRLREIRTIGETVTDQLRGAVARLPGVAITDLYSSQEVGVIALQCPESGLYHIQSESLLVEVLDESGKACNPGEIGRVVVTDLHNLAMPLIRYETGDYAEIGTRCPCGRGLPTLSRILGRRRNMVHTPNGHRHWPHIPEASFRKAMPGLRQWQLVQKNAQEIEVRLVVDGSVCSERESRLANAIRSALGYPFELIFQYQAGALPKTSGGKFEEFTWAPE